MPISVNDLAKKLDIAPEAVTLHAMDMDFEVPEDELLPDDIAAQITKLEQGDELLQAQHELEDELDREIVESQQKQTAGNKKVAHKKKEEKKEEEEVIEIKKEEDGTIILPEYMTVKEFSVKISKPIPIVLIKLKANGVIANLKQEIDYETANIVAEDLGIKVRKESSQMTGHQLFRGDLKEMLADEEEEFLIERPPVVSIMGHVDHGKTSILDHIRDAKVVDGEAGGITQRIGAYQVEVDCAEGKGKQKITFLDTPGHEAFTVMRARGARATDVAILVVAATEGLMPQSIEAINHAKAAEIPIIVAINKMDLPGANPDLVKGQLAENEINPDDWGGDTPCIPVSAKTGLGIDDLLTAVQVVAAGQGLKANPDRNAIATVIESAVDPKIGVMATVLVNTGTLKVSDPFVIYDQNGKIRIMKDFAGKPTKVAPPSTPVQILGLSKLPNVGDVLQVMKSDKEARKKAEEVAGIVHEDELGKRKKISLAAMKAKLKEQSMKQFKIIVKADSQGTLEAVVDQAEQVKTDDVFTKVVHYAAGDVQESDVMLASAGNDETVIVAFNVNAAGRIEKLADREGVRILHYDVIYKMTEEIQEILDGTFKEVEPETTIGQMILKGVFAANKKMAVIGGEIMDGEIRQAVLFRQFRKNPDYDKTDEDSQEELLLGTGKVESVQQGQKEVGKVETGAECGLRAEHKELVFEVGDRLEFYVVNKQP